MDSLRIGLSGTIAAQTRVANNANNTVNQATTTAVPGTPSEYDGYRPVRTPSQSLANGNGARPNATLVDPAFVLAFNPNNPDANPDGVVARPNVDLAREQVDTIQAQTVYDANLTVIKTADEMLGTLIDTVE